MRAHYSQRGDAEMLIARAESAPSLTENFYIYKDQLLGSWSGSYTSAPGIGNCGIIGGGTQRCVTWLFLYGVPWSSLEGGIGIDGTSEL